MATDTPTLTPDETTNTPETPSTAVAEEAPAPELTFAQGPAAAATTGLEAGPQAHRRGRIDRFGVAMGTGRRKTAVARVRLKGGSGEFLINGRPMNEYFRIERDRTMVEAPLKATDTLGKVDIRVRVQGGGTTGQTGAVVLGVARALETLYPNLHQVLKDGGYLTRDSRMVERKKYGFKKARRSFQFSKR